MFSMLILVVSILSMFSESHAAYHSLFSTIFSNTYPRWYPQYCHIISITWLTRPLILDACDDIHDILTAFLDDKPYYI